MSRPATFHKPIFLSFTLACVAAAWWGCATPTGENTTSTSADASSGSGGTSSGSGGVGGMDVGFDGGDALDDGASCVSTSAVTQHIQLDMVFLIDRSGSMSGPKWMGTTSGLTTFFNDPASSSIGAGLLYMPNPKASTCFVSDYDYLTVPIDVLPKNAFALTNSMPADATGAGTPTWGALKGALLVATAYQDAHPTHKVVVVLATDGDPDPLACNGANIDAVAALALSARNYNGVLTFVIGAQGSTIANLSKVAAAGGTTAAYDITNDISQFSAAIADIRKASLGCDFQIPPPPGNQQLDPNKVNFSYTPQGMGTPNILLRANDLADCNGKPGWYYDNNLAPTKITLCPASCSTVQADGSAKVDVLFGCKSLIN